MRAVVTPKRNHNKLVKTFQGATHMIDIAMK